MKKIIFSLCFVGFCFATATAQQNELFEINKHIQKKQAEAKKSAERKKITTFFKNRNKANLTMGLFSNKPEHTYTLPNGDRVIILSQDNMPCVVPDMKKFQTMPNAGTKAGLNNFYIPRRSQPGIIPNGSMPFRMIAYHQNSGKK